MGRRYLWIVVACACSWLGTAAADDGPPTPPPATAPVPTTLAGRVTDIHGKAIAGARVYVLPRGGTRIQTETDGNGRYAVELGAGGAYAVVFAVKQVNTFRQVLVAEHAVTPLDVLVEIDVDGGEVIKITEERVRQPAIPAQPLGGESRKSLPYSDQAMKRDAWARAWLLLDIDETGHVTRLKMLKRPGFDLDQIAIDEAFKLVFEPARDAAGKPMRTYLLWDMEWPSAGWLAGNVGTAAGRPVSEDKLYKWGRHTSARGSGDATKIKPGVNPGPGHFNADPLARGRDRDTPRAPGRSGGLTGTLNPAGSDPPPVMAQVPMDRVPCAGRDPLDLDRRNRAFRDCSGPDLENVDQLPWITRDNAKTALAELAATRPQLTAPRKRGSRVPELITGGIAVASAAALVTSFVKYNSFNDHATTTNGAVLDKQMADLAFWNRAMLGSAAVCIISTVTTAVLSSRHASRDSFNVQPTRGGGGLLSWGRAF
ncbi:MAG: carboxypeptidase regulatory-like domain-containing protein [Deltaproteobacteria bacterium]|nr:carboxypeptidase regulatory-like domain-containing protein [Deltaproteobacteria bacterium]